MSTTAINTTLEERVEELEKKAERIGDSKDTESRVDSASEGIGRICKRLDDVTGKAGELQFYVRLYEGAFDERRREEIQTQVGTALEKVKVDDEELLAAAQEKRLADIEDQVEGGEASIDDAIDAMRNAIEDEQSDWETDLKSAEELNEIVGGGSGFQNLIGNMRRFLTNKMWNTSKDPSQLQAQWKRYEQKWEENAGKHGWETFQRDHDLDDSTVEELKQFGDDEPVRLSDLSLHTLEEIKRVPELESALQLEVRS
jgi:soluble cytochrome b562